MADASSTTLEHCLLGLLSLMPGTGYDVMRVFETTPLAHFSSSPGAIYPALKRLHRRGLLDDRLDTSTEARPRRIYSLSPDGGRVLDEWLRRPVTREELIRAGGAPILRFSLMEGRLTPREVVEYLLGYRAVVREYLAELYDWRTRIAEAAGLHQRLALEDGIRGYEATAGWVDHAIEVIEAAQESGTQKG